MQSRRRFRATVVPPEVLRVIEEQEPLWSDHAFQSARRLGIGWPDVVNVARSAYVGKRSRPRAPGEGCVEAMIGRDRWGRRLCLAGRIERDEGEAYWYVITVHQAS